MPTQEAAEDASELVAGTVARVAALLCDAGLLLLAWGLLWGAASLADPAACAALGLGFFGRAVPAYFLAASWLLAESLGQRFVGLRVLDAKYYPISRLRLVFRTFLFLLTLPLCVLNVPLVAFTRDGRALHDLAAGTKVMKDPSASRLRLAAAALFGAAVAVFLAVASNLVLRDRIALRAVLPARAAAASDPLAGLRSALTVQETAATPEPERAP